MDDDSDFGESLRHSEEDEGEFCCCGGGGAVGCASSVT